MSKISFKEGVEIDFDALTEEYAWVVFKEMLEAAAEVYEAYNAECVCTSYMDGKHGPSSFHYEGLAIDLRIWPFPTVELQEEVVRELQVRLGNDYDVVLEPNHIHVEFDPR